MPAPTLAFWKGDRVAACVAAGSIIAKVTRDRLLVQLHERWPAYDFAQHKGYSSPEHMAALAEHGPCPEHRFSYVNVRASQRATADRAVRQDGPVDEQRVEVSA